MYIYIYSVQLNENALGVSDVTAQCLVDNNCLQYFV